MKYFSLVLLFVLVQAAAISQDDADYVRTHAVRIEHPTALNDSVYKQLNSFQVILFGEMHGTNEAVPFIEGLAQMFLDKGDSLLIGMEIPPEQMRTFMQQRTDSNIYRSEFFSKKASDGRQSTAWAGLLSKFHNHPKVHFFFYDINTDEGRYHRDSLMAAKIKSQYQAHPSSKIICLGGNYHNRISGEPTMAKFLLKDEAMKICSLNMEYSGGTARADFGKGLEIRELGSYPSAYNSTLSWEHFLLMVSPGSGYSYHGFYFTRTISAATMTNP